MKVISVPLTEDGAKLLYDEISNHKGYEIKLEIYYPERIRCYIIEGGDIDTSIYHHNGSRVNMYITYDGDINITIEGDYTHDELELVYLFSQLIYKLKGGNKKWKSRVKCM